MSAVMKAIGEYRVIRKINEGASGIVYLVEKDASSFALKLLKDPDASALVRFRRESSTLARMKHEGLVSIHGVGEYEGAPYMIMDLLEGDNLELSVKQNPLGLAEEPCVRMAQTIAGALAEVHKNNLVHRDVKPSNIFVLGTDKFKLIDFGLIGDVIEIEKEKSVVGTPNYCSPEQSHLLKRPVDPRSDLYSLGVTLFEVLTGTTPFKGTLTEILQQHAAKVAADVRDIKPTIRPALAAITAKLLAKDPDDRYPTAMSLIHDLGRLDEIDRLLKSQADPGLGAKHRTSYSKKVKYVSRETEERKIQAAWGMAAAGRPGLAIVMGPSGSGKSRMCEEFVGTLDSDHVLYLKSKCQVFDKGLPLGPIREAIESFVDESLELPEAERALIVERIKNASRGVEAAVANFSKSVNRILKVKAGDTSSSSEDTAQDSYFRSIAKFFASLCDEWGSIVVVVDDLQWMDATSLKLLEIVFETLERRKFLLLGSSRNDEGSRPALEVVRQTLSSHVLETVELEAFGAKHTGELVSQFLGVNDFDEKIIALIHSRSQGNPFVAIDFLRACLDEGALRFQGGQWLLDESALEKLSLSDDVYANILQRLTAAPLEAKKLLQCAAIFGNTFSAPEIAAVAGIPRNELAPLTGLLESLGMIQELSRERWQFVHDRIVEGMIQSLSIEERSGLAGGLARHYLARLARQTQEEINEGEILTVARLCQSAVEHVESRAAFDANVAAGDLALKNFAFKEAYAYFKFAFDSSPRAAKTEEDTLRLKASVASRLAGCASILGFWDEANGLSNLAIEESRSEEELIECLLQRVWIARRNGDSVLAWEYFQLVHDRLIGHYPRYTLGKILLCFGLGALVMVLDWLFPWKPEPKKARRKKEVVALTDLYYKAFNSIRIHSKTYDSSLVAIKLCLLGLKERDANAQALGYACMAFVAARYRALMPWAHLYDEKALAFAKEAEDPYLLAQCMSLGESGSLFKGTRLDYDKVLLEDWDFYAKYLDPTSKTLLYDVIGLNLTNMGFTQSALTLLQRIHAELERSGIANAKTEQMNTFVRRWDNNFLVGNYDAAQKNRAAALKIGDELRWDAVYGLIPMRTEVNIRRFSGEMDELFNEVLEFRAEYDQPSFRQSDVFYKNSPWVYLLLRKIEAVAKEGDEQELLTLRHLFANSWLRNDRILTSPFLLAAHNHQAGRYYFLMGEYAKAKHYLEKAESYVQAGAAPITLFDLHADFARLAKATGAKRRAKSALLFSYEVALEQEWPAKIQLLESEFPEELARIKSVVGHDTSGSTSVSGSRSSRTSMRSRSSLTRMNNRTSMARNQTAGLSSSEVEDTRFSDAILNVSSAFVKAFNITDQSKIVLSEVVKLFVAERGFVFLKSEKEEALSMIAGKNSNGADLTGLSGFSSTVVNKAFSTGKPVIVTGTDEGEVLGSESAVLNNLRSIMATPLSAKDGVIGVVYLDSTLAKGLFTESDLELFSTLSNHISVAFELSRMTQIELEKAALQKEIAVQSAIAAESRKVAVLVDNMQQALFAVDQNGVIINPVSRFSEKVLGRSIADQNIVDVLYKGEKLERVDSIRSALNTVYGEDDLQWDLASDIFPRKVRYEQPGSQEATLRVLPSPIWDERGLLEKILFVVEDITQLEALESQINDQRAYAAMFEEVLSNNVETLSGFFDRTFDGLRNLRAAAGVNAAASFLTILRDLHTLKGNARLFKLKLLSEQVHESESRLGELKDVKDAAALASGAIAELEKIEAIARRYEAIQAKIKGGAPASQASFNEAAWEKLTKLIPQFEGELSPAEFRLLTKAVRQLRYVPFSQLLAPFVPMVDDLAAQLGKKATITLPTEGAVDPDLTEALKDCFLHILRNSLDHGLEAPADRLALGKPEAGKIVVDYVEDADGARILIQDDGRGIDPDRVLKKALEKKLLTEEAAAKLSRAEKIALIFAPGFSTRDEATDLSGRGLGLDIVKSELEKLGGTVTADAETGKGSTFTITLPARPLRAAKAA